MSVPTPTLPPSEPTPPPQAPQTPTQHAPGLGADRMVQPGGHQPGMAPAAAANPTSTRLRWQSIGSGLARAVGFALILGAGAAGWFIAEERWFADDAAEVAAPSMWPSEYSEVAPIWPSYEVVDTTASGGSTVAAVMGDTVRWNSSIGEVEMGADWALLRESDTTWRLLDPGDHALLVIRDRVETRPLRIAQLVPRSLQPFAMIQSDEASAVDRRLVLSIDLDAFKAELPLEAAAWSLAVDRAAAGQVTWTLTVDDAGRLLSFDDGQRMTTWTPTPGGAATSPGRAGIDDPANTAISGRWIRVDRFSEGRNAGPILNDLDRDVVQFWRNGGADPLVESSSTQIFQKQDDGSWADMTGEVGIGIDDIHTVFGSMSGLRLFDLSFPADNPHISITELETVELGRRIRVDIDYPAWYAADPDGLRARNPHVNALYRLGSIDESLVPSTYEIDVDADGYIVRLYFPNDNEFLFSQRSGQIPLESALPVD